MMYEEGERDLVMLQHKFVVEWQDGKAVSPASLPYDIVPTFERRMFSHRPWRYTAIQLVIPPWPSPSAFLAELPLS